MNEGFESPGTTSHNIVIPPVLKQLPMNGPEKVDAVKPSSLPGPLPIAPYEQIAAMSPLPYQDTTMIKANRQQIVSLLENLKGFLAFQAQEISERSDPSIQLPLQTAKSDFHSLQSEVEVLNRNPGIQPTITLSHLNEIASNLAYLQQQVQLTGAAGSLQGPIHEFEDRFTTQEGFYSPPVPPPKAVTTAATAANATAANALNPNASKLGQTIQPAATNPITTAATAASQIATLEDLKAFIARIQGEIIRLSASGTTDPIVKARVAALTQMKSDVQTVVSQIVAGTMMTTEIPIMKSEIDKALPILGKPSEPLPQIIKALHLPAGLANVLPSNIQKDPATMNEISKLLGKYADQIMDGVSATFSVKYTSANEAKMHQHSHPHPHSHHHDQHDDYNHHGSNGHMHNRYEENAAHMARSSTIDKSGFPSMADLHNVSNSKFMPHDSGAPVTDRTAPHPIDAGRGPSHFDWKQRTKEVEDQVKKRGLKQTDYGIMPKDTKVSNNFSWKGYLRMICSRLQATMDPSLPETCGCPPMDWPGWR